MGSASTISSSPTEPETAQATRASRISSGVLPAWTSISRPGAAPSFAITLATIPSASFRWRSCRQATPKRTPGRCDASLFAARTISGRFRKTSWVREPGRIATSSPGSLALLRQEARVERPVRELVEVGMADVDRILEPARVIPGRLERQAAQDEIDVLLDLLDPPAGPGPDLRRHEVEDRDAPRLGAAGDPPVQARVVDQHHGVGPFVAKIAIGLEDQPDERHEVQQDVQEPHHRQVDERIEQAGAGLLHVATAEADELGVGNELAERANQVGGVQVAARLTGGDEDSHGINRFLAGRIRFDPSLGRGTN